MSGLGLVGFGFGEGKIQNLDASFSVSELFHAYAEACIEFFRRIAKMTVMTES